MRYPILLLLAAALSLPLCAADPAPASVQTGKLAAVELLTTRRLPPKESPAGVGFLFLVAPADAGNVDFAIKETKDFLVDGASYQEKTQAELGKRFEPGTEVFDAGKFFTENPRLKPTTVDMPNGTRVISLMIRGGTLPPNGRADVTLHVGYGRKAEPFTFSVPLPAPARPKA